MTTIYQFRMTCDPTGGATASAEHIIWDTVAPTTCPTDNANHILDPATITVIEKVEEQVFKIREEEVITGGHLHVTSRRPNITGPTGSVQDFDYNWPIDLNFMSVILVFPDASIGDKFDVILAPDTTIGVLTANAPTGATGISVSQTVIDNMDVGYWVSLFDGVNYNDLGMVTKVDTVNNKLEFETPPTTSFSAASPTYVQMNIKYASDIYIGYGGPLRWGDDKIGGAFIPKNTVLRVRYWNLTGGQKEMVIIGTYLY